MVRDSCSRSGLRIVHLEVDVKSWASAPPSCAAARPGCCPACGTAGWEPGRRATVVGPRRKTAYCRGPAGTRRGADERPDTQPPLPLPSLHRGDRGPAPRGRPRRALSGLRHRIRPGALGSGWPHRLADTRVLRPRAASSRVLLEREAAGTLAAARAWIGDAEALDDHRKRAELRYGRVDFGPTPGHREHTRRELDG